MQLARVTGTVVATVKDPGLAAKKLLILAPLANPDRVVVALDAVGAGVGETVYFCRGREASLAWADGVPPTDAAVVGIADPAANPPWGGAKPRGSKLAASPGLGQPRPAPERTPVARRK